ncbi:MAG TPA: DoxX family protein [Acidimicrobiia bacterium]|nr:DoxX family protein [Acidimicrobiia bacterium]
MFKSNGFLWAIQIIFGIYFIAIGIMHFVVPEGLPAPMEWMYDLSDTLHIVTGTAEILGGLGLILPGLTKIRPELTIYAAAGLAILMVGALIYHLNRGEMQNVVTNVVVGAIMAYLAYARWKLTPLESR